MVTYEFIMKKWSERKEHRSPVLVYIHRQTSKYNDQMLFYLCLDNVVYHKDFCEKSRVGMMDHYIVPQYMRCFKRITSSSSVLILLSLLKSLELTETYWVDSTMAQYQR